MRLESPRLRSLLPWTLAALALAGCSKDPAPVAPPSTPAESKPVAETPVPAAAKPAMVTELPLPVEPGKEVAGTIPSPAKIEGAVEYEEGVEKPLVTSFPEAPAEQPRPKVENLPSDDALFGRPLVINGQVVPFDAIRRRVCLGGVGTTEIDETRIQIYIRQEVERRLAEGASEAELAVSDPELESFLAELEADVKREYPNGDVGMEDVLSGLASNDPRERLRTERLFEKLFLPEDPSKFPPATLAAIDRNGGESLLEFYRDNFKKRSEGTLERTVAERSFNSAVLGQVLAQLEAGAKIERDPAPGVLYRVNGVDITLDSVWNAIRPFVTTMEVRGAKQWITNFTLARAELEKAGAWLTDEEAAASYEKESAPYRDSIFSIENLAVGIKKFPSVDSYKEYQHLYDSFARYKEKEMTKEVLDKHAEFRTNKVVGQVSADVDVILCSAYDFKANRWKDNGWAEAEARMKDVVNLLVEEQQPWDVLVERYSDFYDPPTPLSQQGQEDPERAHKGRFRNVQRNILLGMLGESEYWLFLNGNSIADFVFFQQEVQSLGKPMRGPLGWYLPRLIRRTKPPERITMDPTTRDQLVRDDYLMWYLNEFCQELIRKNEVFGLDFPSSQTNGK